ncbi:hypothetical protein BC831DRAFT_549166 [Entophlyctis helioformis]|nr:hypothetical protein BC831DRAFT_549166 [Entophlyctis helioformis]
MSPQVVPICAGFLQKLNRRQGISWSKRHVRLQNSAVAYYHSADTDIDYRWKIRCLDIAKVTLMLDGIKDKEKVEKVKNVFCITASDGSEIYFAGRTPEEAKFWVDSIQQEVKKAWNLKVARANEVLVTSSPRGKRVSAPAGSLSLLTVPGMLSAAAGAPSPSSPMHGSSPTDPAVNAGGLSPNGQPALAGPVGGAVSPNPASHPPGASDLAPFPSSTATTSSNGAESAMGAGAAISARPSLRTRGLLSTTPVKPSKKSPLAGDKDAGFASIERPSPAKGAVDQAANNGNQSPTTASPSPSPSPATAQPQPKTGSGSNSPKIGVAINVSASPGTGQGGNASATSPAKSPLIIRSGSSGPSNGPESGGFGGFLNIPGSNFFRRKSKSSLSTSTSANDIIVPASDQPSQEQPSMFSSNLQDDVPRLANLLREGLQTLKDIAEKPEGTAMQLRQRIKQVDADMVTHSLAIETAIRTLMMQELGKTLNLDCIDCHKEKLDAFQETLQSLTKAGARFSIVQADAAHTPEQLSEVTAEFISAINKTHDELAVVVAYNPKLQGTADTASNRNSIVHTSESNRSSVVGETDSSASPANTQAEDGKDKGQRRPSFSRGNSGIAAFTPLEIVIESGRSSVATSSNPASASAALPSGSHYNAFPAMRTSALSRQVDLVPRVSVSINAPASPLEAAAPVNPMEAPGQQQANETQAA